jgi:predicted NUDIX family phosphoesterase
MSEQVLVVARSRLFHGSEGAFEGLLCRGAEVYLERIAQCGQFLARDAVEDDPTFKQVIPYGVVTYTGASGEEQVFLMRRRRGGTERRLHDLYSLGVGGHVNPADAESSAQARSRGAAGSVEAALAREIAEELSIRGPSAVRRLGVLNDDSNAVGQVHFGVVFRVQVCVPEVAVRETEQLEGEFVSSERLHAYASAMESWSRWVWRVLAESE